MLLHNVQYTRRNSSCTKEDGRRATKESEYNKKKKKKSVRAWQSLLYCSQVAEAGRVFFFGSLAPALWSREGHLVAAMREFYPIATTMHVVLFAYMLHCSLH